MAKTYTQVLTIAGSDCSGGAGIQADIKTFSALGCYAMSVITALTAQNTRGVRGIHPVPPAFLKDQLDAIFEDMPPAATKIGMLHTAEQIQVVADRISAYTPPNVVLDPVMRSQGGISLLEADAMSILKTEIIPLSTLVTPNLPEASVLLNRPIRNLNDMKSGARELAVMTRSSVLLKGGHMKGHTVRDLLFLHPENRFECFEAERIHTVNDHGTGCTLSAAITAFLAKKDPIPKAVGAAKAYVTQALKGGAPYEIGKGHGPLHHFYDFW